MDQSVTGKVIRKLRKSIGLTQAELAKKLNVSDKTVSKWETAKGGPDISLLEPIADAFGISVYELLSGDTVYNRNVSANVMRSVFYVCPICGNTVHAMGDAAISCHGIALKPCIAAPADENHGITVERVEDEYFVSVDHGMAKEHYISFIAAVSKNKLQFVKLYPESGAEARFKIDGVERFYYYCTRDKLFYADIK